MTELKPCPFCGGVANVIDHHNDDGSVSVGCNNDTCLGFSGLGWLYRTEAEAAEAWNTRAATTIGQVAVEVVPTERTCTMELTDLSSGSMYHDVWLCSACGEQVEQHTVMGKSEPPRYCPSCGAKVVDE